MRDYIKYSIYLIQNRPSSMMIILEILKKNNDTCSTLKNKLLANRINRLATGMPFIMLTDETVKTNLRIKELRVMVYCINQIINNSERRSS